MDHPSRRRSLALACALWASPHCDLLAQVPIEHGALLVTVVDQEGAPQPGVFVKVVRFEGGDAPYSNLDLVDAREARVVQRLPTSDRGTVGLQLPVGVPYRVVVDHPPFAIEWQNNIYAGSECEVRLRPAGALEGTVALDDGTPIEGATVELSARTRGERRTAKTDATGHYVFERLQPGPLFVSVDTIAGAVMAGEKPVIVEGQTTKTNFSIDPGALVRGTITDGATGEPIAGASVGVGWTFDKAVTSDKDGVYALQGLGGPYSNNLYCKAPGYCELQIDRPKADPEGGVVELDLELRRGFAVSGVIVDIDGRPVRGSYVAVVGMTHNGSRQETDWFSVRTDEAGRFRIEDLRAELEPVLLVRHELRSTQVLPIEIGDGTRDVDVGQIALQPRRLVQGTVLDGEQNGVPGIEVSLLGAGSAAPKHLRGTARGHILWSYLSEREVKTDARGRFFIGDVPAGTYVLKCDGEEFSVEVKPDRDPEPIDVLR